MKEMQLSVRNNLMRIPRESRNPKIQEIFMRSRANITHRNMMTQLDTLRTVEWTFERMVGDCIGADKKKKERLKAL